MDLHALATQLRKPEGDLGKQVGQMMNKGNELINLWTIEQLHLEPGDEVLEIGMGNGYFAKEVLAVHPGINYTGMDFSELMVEESITLNQQFINEGRARFHLGAANQLPYPDAAFSKIFTINTVYFWGDANQELKEMKRVLKPGGIFAIGIRSKETMQQMPFTQHGFVKYDKNALEEKLRTNGFTTVSSVEKGEPPYTFNGQIIVMENIITTCR